MRRYHYTEIINTKTSTPQFSAEASKAAMTQADLQRAKVNSPAEKQWKEISLQRFIMQRCSRQIPFIAVDTGLEYLTVFLTDTVHSWGTEGFRG